jgi:hypothetical protein
MPPVAISEAVYAVAVVAVGKEVVVIASGAGWAIVITSDAWAVWPGEGREESLA